MHTIYVTTLLSLLALSVSGRATKRDLDVPDKTPEAIAKAMKTWLDKAGEPALQVWLLDPSEKGPKHNITWGFYNWDGTEPTRAGWNRRKDFLMKRDDPYITKVIELGETALDRNGPKKMNDQQDPKGQWAMQVKGMGKCIFQGLGPNATRALDGDNGWLHCEGHKAIKCLEPVRSKMTGVHDIIMCDDKIRYKEWSRCYLPKRKA